MSTVILFESTSISSSFLKQPPHLGSNIWGDVVGDDVNQPLQIPGHLGKQTIFREKNDELGKPVPLHRDVATNHEMKVLQGTLDVVSPPIGWGWERRIQVHVQQTSTEMFKSPEML